MRSLLPGACHNRTAVRRRRGGSQPRAPRRRLESARGIAQRPARRRRAPRHGGGRGAGKRPRMAADRADDTASSTRSPGDGEDIRVHGANVAASRVASRLARRADEGGGQVGALARSRALGSPGPGGLRPATAPQREDARDEAEQQHPDAGTSVWVAAAQPRHLRRHVGACRGSDGRFVGQIADRPVPNPSARSGRSVELTSALDVASSRPANAPRPSARRPRRRRGRSRR